MENSLKKQVKNKVVELVEVIKTSELYQTYLMLSEKMENNTEIQSRIKQIKKWQKELVRKEASGDYSETKEYEEKIQELLNELQEYPLYLDFIEVQERLDTLFQKVRREITSCFDEETK